jgi:hypothetical protein
VQAFLHARNVAEILPRNLQHLLRIGEVGHLLDCRAWRFDRGRIGCGREDLFLPP